MLLTIKKDHGANDGQICKLLDSKLDLKTENIKDSEVSCIYDVISLRTGKKNCMTKEKIYNSIQKHLLVPKVPLLSYQ